MAFDPHSLPPATYAAFLKGPNAWPLVVQKGYSEGITDPDKLTSIVFYLNHPERHGKAIQPHESALIQEWKSTRVLVVNMLAKPPGNAPAPAETWMDDVTGWQIKKQWGQAIFEWANVPPNGTEVKEFFPPGSEAAHYKTVFGWKCWDPGTACIANPKQRLQFLMMLRDDQAYWNWRTGGKYIATEMLRTAAETALRDYRSFIIGRKMCPKAAYNRLVGINKDMIYQMFLGMFQMMSPVGVPNAAPALTEAIANLLGKIAESKAKPG
jgi:hypothetical protein